MSGSGNTVEICSRDSGEKMAVIRGALFRDSLYSKAEDDHVKELEVGMKINVILEVLEGEVTAYYSGRLKEGRSGLAAELRRFSFSRGEDRFLEYRIPFEMIVIRHNRRELRLPVEIDDEHQRELVRENRRQVREEEEEVGLEGRKKSLWERLLWWR